MVDFTINKKEHIQYIIENFNFEKVYKVMESLHWTWLDQIDHLLLKN